MFYLLKGFIIGLLVAAPVGPIGLLCIRRTLSFGRVSGFISGLGAATADASYGLVAALGLTVISSIMLKGRLVLGLAGGLFLCYLGIKTILAKPAEKAAALPERGRIKDYFSTLGLTVTNPATILSFLGIFAGLGVTSDYFASCLLVIGVFAGSATWWLILTTGISLIKHRLSSGAMLWIDRASGVFIFAFGIAALIKAM